ncbi:hypothetical protein [Clostridium intestinale]|uniref:Uncharacterized protein n=1 Tax=Clostridium intestinale URNW TaxID=1294142 RepID=U2NP34_9CLOT|nr:hypothetical protein [Clostridium intestinale]ERK30591.1 hypothetical protein CINTURNW_1714 [Clostridium intestinale URNW]
MRKNSALLGALLVLVSILFTRLMVNKYGEASRLIIITVALIISIIGLLGIIYTKNHRIILGAFMMILPLIVMTIGIYIDNLYVSGIGLLLIFILIPIMIKMLNIKK